MTNFTKASTVVVLALALGVLFTTADATTIVLALVECVIATVLVLAFHEYKEERE